MYGIIRMMLGLIFLCSSLLVINKSNIRSKRLLRVLSITISIVLVTALSFFPFENLFITFESPDAVYKYYTLGKSDIDLVIEGESCDLVVDESDGTYTHYVAPRTEDGWKIGIGIDLNEELHIISNGVAIQVYQYKNTGEYFLVLLDSNGGETEVRDSIGSSFSSLEQNNDVIGKNFVTYFAYISNFNQGYYVEVNGNRIVLQP